ncbi:unnamed protein product, partial [Prorocentrum cordatum]
FLCGLTVPRTRRCVDPTVASTRSGMPRTRTEAEGGKPTLGLTAEGGPALSPSAARSTRECSAGASGSGRLRILVQGRRSPTRCHAGPGQAVLPGDVHASTAWFGGERGGNQLASPPPRWQQVSSPSTWLLVCRRPSFPERQCSGAWFQRRPTRRGTEGISFVHLGFVPVSGASTHAALPEFVQHAALLELAPRDLPCTARPETANTKHISSTKMMASTFVDTSRPSRAASPCPCPGSVDQGTSTVHDSVIITVESGSTTHTNAECNTDVVPAWSYPLTLQACLLDNSTSPCPSWSFDSQSMLSALPSTASLAQRQRCAPSTTQWAPWQDRDT